MEQRTFNLEGTDNPDEIREIVSKVVEKVDTNHIYLNIGGKQQSYKYWFIIVTGDYANRFREEKEQFLKVFFGMYPGCVVSYFTPTQIGEQESVGTTFFVNNCNRENMIYTCFEDRSLAPFDEKDLPRVLNSSRTYYEKEIEKVRAFRKGAMPFIGEGNFELAGFMFHQTLEMGYRLAEHFLLGHTHKGHSIREHQNFMGDSSSAFGEIFSQNIEEDIRLLNKLDKSYVKSRYSKDFMIEEEQVDLIKGSVDMFILKLEEYIPAELEKCQRRIEDKRNSTIQESLLQNNNDESQKQTPLLNRLRELEWKYCGTLEPSQQREGHYSLKLINGGYQETMLMITNLIKVCMMAIEYPHGPSKWLQEPDIVIADTMGHILDLMPYDEMEFLDEVRQLLSETPSND
ncbi:HEPN domain-containing protein [Flagellimonas oceanensis]|uniref:HEPN domain-containing protein n=1 Tax=Flagellimonas oceanensis TaxID=2499163 RepID=UPI003BAA164C